MAFGSLSSWLVILVLLIWSPIYNRVIKKFKIDLPQHSVCGAYLIIIMLAAFYQSVYLISLNYHENTDNIIGLNFVFSGGGAGDHLSQENIYITPFVSRSPGTSFLFPRFDTKIKIIKIKIFLIYNLDNLDDSIYTSLLKFKGDTYTTTKLAEIKNHIKKVSVVDVLSNMKVDFYYDLYEDDLDNFILNNDEELKYYIRNTNLQHTIKLHPDSYIVLHYQKYNEIPSLYEKIINNFEIPFLFTVLIYIDKFFKKENK